jgi:hypothetical protein
MKNYADHTIPSEIDRISLGISAWGGDYSGPDGLGRRLNGRAERDVENMNQRGLLAEIPQEDGIKTGRHVM